MSGTNLRLDDDQINDMMFGKNNIAGRLNAVKNYIRQNKQDPNLVTLTDE
jgi:hypothetical protein